MNVKRLLLAATVFCCLTTAVAQKPLNIEAGEFCEGYLLKRVAREKAGGSRMARLRASDPDVVTYPDLNKWLETRDEKKLVAAELKYKEKKALILSSVNLGATGIASNFQNWYLRAGERPVEFLSLSEDPRLIFWDRDGLLNYYVVNYGSEFLKDKDWGNLTLDLLRYRVGPDGEPRLVSEERDRRCK